MPIAACTRYVCPCGRQNGSMTGICESYDLAFVYGPQPHCLRVLQAIIEALGVAIPQLSSVIGLFMILFIIFCLAGVALFSGSFHRRCVLPSGPDPSDYVYSYIPWFCGNLNPITHKSKARSRVC